MNPTDWPSLETQIKLATTLFGERGLSLIEKWLEVQTGLISNPAFARRFTYHSDQSGFDLGDYNHRLIEVQGNKLLGGIRFFDQDVSKPYVEVIAHSFDDWNALKRCVIAEWAAFTPQRIRVLVTPDTPVPTDAYIDLTVHAAQYQSMKKPDGRVQLDSFENAEEVIKLVNGRYADIEKSSPELAMNVTPESPEDIRELFEDGDIRAIKADINGVSKTVGMLSIIQDSVEWIEGDLVYEEVIASAYIGNGFAAAAQCCWAVRDDIDPTRLLIGTIDKLNIASKRTAINAGRDIVLNYLFLPLDNHS